MDRYQMTRQPIEAAENKPKAGLLSKSDDLPVQHYEADGPDNTGEPDQRALGTWAACG
jgi:hypothetical protein